MVSVWHSTMRARDWKFWRSSERGSIYFHLASWKFPKFPSEKRLYTNGVALWTTNNLIAIFPFIQIKVQSVEDNYSFDIGKVKGTGDWKLTSVKINYEENYPGRVFYNLTIKRQGSYYVLKFVTPACIAALLTIIMLLLRPDFKIKYILGTFSFLKTLS